MTHVIANKNKNIILEMLFSKFRSIFIFKGFTKIYIQCMLNCSWNIDFATSLTITTIYSKIGMKWNR